MESRSFIDVCIARVVPRDVLVVKMVTDGCLLESRKELVRCAQFRIFRCMRGKFLEDSRKSSGALDFSRNEESVLAYKCTNQRPVNVTHQ